MLYNTVVLTCKATEEIASKATETSRFQQPHCHLTLPLQDTFIQIFVVGPENACILKQSA